jgi:trans-aconitate methyltransferase
MANRKATDVFHDWAIAGKDVGMEKGHSSAVSEMLNFIFQKAEKSQNEFSAIDVGCGNGWVVRLLKEHPLCYSAEGIDGAKAMIEKAKEIDSEGNYYIGQLPEFNPSKRYDMIHSMEFLYYLKDPKSMLKLFFNNWLTENGWLVVGIDHYLEHEESLSWPEHVGVHMSTLSTQEWLDAWSAAGFSNISTWQAGEKGNVTLVIVGQKK